MKLKIEKKGGGNVEIEIATDVGNAVRTRLDPQQVQRLIDLLQMALKAKTLSLELDV